MPRETIKRIHGAAAFIALMCIATFWLSTVISELFLSHSAVATVKLAILYAFALLVPAIMATGMTGMKLGGKSRHPLIAAKRRRMPVIAANGVLILIPCAFFLSHRASAGTFDGVFYAVQALELLAGAVNITLMALSIRDARNLKRESKE
ncbi:MAG: hypothetical protein IIT59_01155 [Rhodocyclaceae bacterium]|nr:hypothetical protein [Rhodocyclaceae bacterium]